MLARLERLTLPSAFFYVGPWLDKLATIDLCERLHFELDLGSLREDHAFEQLHVRWTGQPPSAAQRASIEAEIQRLGPKAHFEAPSS